MKSEITAQQEQLHCQISCWQNLNCYKDKMSWSWPFFNRYIFYTVSLSLYNMEKLCSLACLECLYLLNWNDLSLKPLLLKGLGSMWGSAKGQRAEDLYQRLIWTLSKPHFTVPLGHFVVICSYIQFVRYHEGTWCKFSATASFFKRSLAGIGFHKFKIKCRRWKSL